MPRGEPTRVVSVRLPEELVSDLEAKGAQIGVSVGEWCRKVMLGTFRYPGSTNTWEESRERKLLLRLKEEYSGKIAMLSEVMQRRDPEAYAAIMVLWSGTNTSEAQKRAAASVVEREAASFLLR